MEAASILPAALQLQTVPALPVDMQAQDQRRTPQQDAAQTARPAETIRDAFQLSKGRLVIEQDPESRRWIYKTVDTQTGELLSQFPLEKLNSLRLTKSFGLGLVYDARV